MPYPFTTGTELLALRQQHQLSISDIMLINEKHWHSKSGVYAKIDEIWQVMQDYVKKGCSINSILPRKISS